MEKAKVYFTNMRTGTNTNLPKKAEKADYEGRLSSIDFDKKFTAIKIHFGEPGNPGISSS